ncbi:hypothetical protein [Streptomyces sp. WAC01280]|uniref:hypothetical protein n=1 Tax=Streptomyces sp. WAC01280 TaxID=2487424 RepID=UPI000F7915BB|nr:hypothetical protein [Streptomyces sp. WAC01280]RSS52392.1 hypothetical protein EF909_28815 [Streptomyces sp. WAC01280]
MTVTPIAPGATAPEPGARQEPPTATTAPTAPAVPTAPTDTDGTSTEASVRETSAPEPSTPAPTVAEPTPADGPTGATAVPGPRSETAAPEQDAEPDPQPHSQPDPQPAPGQQPEPEPDRPGTGGPRTEAGPRVRAVLVDRPGGPRGETGAEPREPGTKPRLGAVPAAEPSRADAASRRRSVPTVRAVRLTAEPVAPARRPAPAAVTPVPLPLPRPVTDDVPPESRTEEPQP